MSSAVAASADKYLLDSVLILIMPDGDIDWFGLRTKTFLVRSNAFHIMDYDCIILIFCICHVTASTIVRLLTCRSFCNCRDISVCACYGPSE